MGLFGFLSNKDDFGRRSEEAFRQQLLAEGRYAHIQQEMADEAKKLAAKPWPERTAIKISKTLSRLFDC